MKKVAILTCMSLLTSFFMVQVKAQSEEETKKWMEYMTPSAVHKMMASWDGEWTEDINMWMAPDAPAQKMTSSCTNRMILGGRYQESKHIGNFNGMPFEGVGTLAWDNAGKEFINTWVDNFGTGMMVLKGTWDEATKTINLKGEMRDPMTGLQTTVREVLKVIDENTQVMEQYGVKDGKKFKNMEIRMTRKK